MKKRLLSLLLTLGLLAALTSCVGGEAKPTPTPERTKQTATGFYFDTVVLLTIYWPDDAPLKAAQEACAYYESILSKTREGSDVWKLNHAEGERVAVTQDTRDILEKSIEYSKLSNGSFDVTVEPCVALWDFTGDGMGVLPDPDALDSAAAKVDYTQIDINDEGVKLGPGQTIDLGAIAKGYIADRISDLLKEKGVESGILNFGGNVQTIGDKPDGTQWNVGVQDPKGVRQTSLAVVGVTDGAVVTSGIYERGFDVDGVRYHHILDARTGWPVQNDLAGVTIFVDDSFDGDALSTTLFALGEEEGRKLVEQLDGVEVVFINREDGISYTSGLEGRITILE